MSRQRLWKLEDNGIKKIGHRRKEKNIKKKKKENFYHRILFQRKILPKMIAYLYYKKC